MQFKLLFCFGHHKILIIWKQIQEKVQHNPWTSNSVVLDSEGDSNDDLQEAELTSNFEDEAFPFTFIPEKKKGNKSMPQSVIVEKLPEMKEARWQGPWLYQEPQVAFFKGTIISIMVLSSVAH